MPTLSRVSLHYETHGTGSPPLVMLHGFGASVETWRDVQPLLETDFKLYMVDMKGFGKSPKPKDCNYGVLDQAAIVAEFIEEHKLDDVVLVGNSLGGGVALATYIHFKDRGGRNPVAGLVLIDSAAYPQRLPGFVWVMKIPLLNRLVFRALSLETRIQMVLNQAFYDRSKVTPERVRRHAASQDLRGSRHATVVSAKQIVPDHVEAFVRKFKDIAVPTLILWGDHDVIVSPAIAARLHADIPGSELHVLAKCGHIPQEEKPVETANLIRDFVKRIRREIAI